MMRRLPMLIVTMVMLVAMVTGCGGVRSYDSRLTAIDSLMRTDPDSALAMLNALPDSAFTDEGDLAYRRLLLAQARYKAYVTATSDSDINHALDYYRRHSGECEKLTRAYIYKGAVMEELGHPDSAMLYYKHGEANADPNDYFNLGYAKLRMGYLYGQFYSLNGKDIEKYEEAVDCFYHTTDTNYIIYALNNLGCVYRESRPDEAIATFQKASAIAREANDTSSITSISYSLIVLDYYQKKYQEAHQLIQDMMQYPNVRSDAMFYIIASKVYARLGILDSASMFLNLAQQYKDGDEALFRMNYLECLGEMALAKNDSITYLQYFHEVELIADSLAANEEKLKLQSIDHDFDKEQVQRHNDKQNLNIKLLAGIILALIAFSLFWHFHRKHRYDNLIGEIRKESDEKANDLTKLQHDYDKLIDSDQHLKDFINTHSSLMREVIEACYHAPRSALSREIKKILLFQDENKGSWLKLFSYIDRVNNNIMEKTKHDYPQLDEKDLLMIALTTMGYSCAQIAIILGYNNATSISTIRKRIAEKMGLDCSLVEYTQQFSNAHE